MSAVSRSIPEARKRRTVTSRHSGKINSHERKPCGLVGLWMTPSHVLEATSDPAFLRASHSKILTCAGDRLKAVGLVQAVSAPL